MIDVEIKVTYGSFAPPKTMLDDIAEIKAKEHTHDNSETLNRVTDSMLNDIGSNTESRHSHDNKEIIDSISADDLNNIDANTAARHSHSNTDTLNKLGDSNGSLIYKGKVVGNKPTKTAVYDLLEGEGYAFVETTGMRKTLLFVNNEIAATPIAEGTEILSVEMNFSSDAFPEWVSVDNMNAFDPMTPHIVNHSTAFHESSIGYMCVAALFFPISGSLFYNALQSDSLSKIRVTFIDNG